MTTDLYLLLDKSGSMGGREDEVVKHFNEYLNKHKHTPEETFISLAMFEGEHFEWVYQWKPIAKARHLKLEDYVTGDDTPLNDSVGKVIDVAEQNPDTGKLLIIITDGFENASRKYPEVGNAALKARIDALDKTLWGIAYIGEGMSAQVAGAGAAGLNMAQGNFAAARGMSASFAVADSIVDNYYDNRLHGRLQVDLTVDTKIKPPKQKK